VRRKIAGLEYALQQEKISNQNLDHHYKKLWNRANAQGEELQKSQHQVHRLMDDNRSLTHELEAVKVQLADAKKLSEVRGKELKELKVDTTNIDQEANEEESWDMPGGSDILLTAAAIQMVDVLNVEVRRVAAVLGKVLQMTKFEEGHRQIMQITEKARLMLGENMVALLSAGLPEKAKVDPFLVQVVLQIAITNWCKTTISSWKPGNSDASNLLIELYSKIRGVGKSASTFNPKPNLTTEISFFSEDPTFYRRWRTVTWTQLEFSSSGWSQDLLDGLLDIFAFARWPTPNANQKNLFEEQFPPIFNAIRDLRKALGEDITSIDIEVATIDPGTTFDSAFMDNGWPALTKESASDIISGTTSLGLKKVIMKPSTEGDSLTPNADVICRPKVILERTAQKALVPPSSRAQKKGPLKRGPASGDGRG